MHNNLSTLESEYFFTKGPNKKYKFKIPPANNLAIVMGTNLDSVISRT